MRGGAARQFASDWLPHRGIQAEATLATARNKITIFQSLTLEIPRSKVDFTIPVKKPPFGSHRAGSQPEEATARKPLNLRYFSV